MPIFLGLDIGSNSVGSAWVDTDKELVDVGVTIFPAGVAETDQKRGAPLNQKRRDKRQQRKGIARRARRKLRLRRWLASNGFLSNEGRVQQVPDQQAWLVSRDNPWFLRRVALTESLSPLEFGRIVLHMAQRRGAVGLKAVEDSSEVADGDVKDESKDKESGDDAVLATARKHTRELMAKYDAKTYGELMWLLLKERQANPVKLDGTAKAGKTFQRQAVRNRHDLLVKDPENAVYADRELVREEFLWIWRMQKELGGPISSMLTDERLLALDDPQLKRFDKLEDSQRQKAYRETWRHGGELFGQRRTYWDTGTLGRCELEPTDERCPLADMYAQEYRVIETVNNIKTRARGETVWQPLKEDERNRIIAFLRGGTYVPASTGKSKKPPKAKRAPKNVEPKHIRELLGIDKKSMEKRGMPADFYELNLEQDADRPPNTDWFFREIVHGVFGETVWAALNERQRESLNSAIQKLNPENATHVERLRNGAAKWWGLDAEKIVRLISVWESRPKLEKRLKLSRRAIRNLLPYMNRLNAQKKHWTTQIEARQEFAEDKEAKDCVSQLAPTVAQRCKYCLTVTDEFCHVLKDLLGNDDEKLKKVLATRGLTKGERHYLAKHPDLLPPAPVLSNPVVRKAIHEVRRHILAYICKFGRKPDRIVIEMARSAKQPEKMRNRLLSLNRRRNRIRLQLIADLKLEKLSLHQQNAAVDRALLAQQQNMACPYCDNKKLGAITLRRAAWSADELDVDHIVPRSWGGSDGLNNRVICHKGCNMGKSDKPPKLFMSGTDFDALEQRMARLKDESSRDRWNEHDYFTPKDYGRKWDNLHCDQRPKEAWSKSQLTDTAYAAREVGSYLRNALYSNDDSGGQRIFFTKGSYTFLLRKDWRLFQLLKPPGEILDREADADAEKKLAEKDRGDHRHHAIDAVCIALTGPELLQQLSRDAADIERAKAEAGEKGQEAPLHLIRRKRIAPPWGSMVGFRKEVLSQIFERFDAADERGHKTSGAEAGIRLVVSHRPIKRKLTSYFHKEDLYGEIDEEKNLFRIRCKIDELSAKMLQMPEPEDNVEFFKRLERQFKSAGMKPKEAKATVNEIMKSQDAETVENAQRRLDSMYGGSAAKGNEQTVRPTPKYLRRFIDPPYGKGLVRDWALRRIIRDCLEREKVPLESINQKKLQELANAGKFVMPSGVPIKSVMTIGVINGPIKIPVRDPQTGQQAVNLRTGKPLHRYHISRNNHHVEIMMDRENGEWSLRNGECVTVYEATRRVRSSIKRVPTRADGKGVLKRARSFASQSAVDRSNTETQTFVMSLSENEMIRARRKDRPDNPLDYYIVVKLDDKRIHFAPHNDAHNADEQDRWDVTYADLRLCGENPNEPPVKVRVSPLGESVVQND